MKKVFNFFHHLFIPQENNNFRAKAIHPDFLTYYLLIVLFLTFTFKYTPLSNVLGFATDITVEKLYQLTNKQREENGLPPLSLNSKLSEAAAKKAQDMFNKNYWAHYAPDGITPWDFILSSGYQYEYAGENLAKNFLFSEGVIQAWMNSPTHKANILRKDYSEVGYAVVNGVLNGEETTLVVQMFGKPLKTEAKTLVAQPANLLKPISSSVIAEEKTILSNKSTQPKFNLTHLSFNINLMFIVSLLLTLGLDFYFAQRLGIIRIGGKNIAHFIFISFILLAFLTVIKGKIL